jgi:hypothetical protein
MGHETKLAGDRLLPESIKTAIPNANVINTTEQQDNSLRLLVEAAGVRIKIELSPVIRGCVFPPVRMEVRKIVEQNFGYAEIQVASHSDLFAGKICAALDRQHPRDLFDIKFLLENEGLTEDLRKTFLIFLISHQRPVHELLAPNLNDIKRVYETEFAAMAQVDVSVEELEIVRQKLIQMLNESLTPQEKKFLLSFKNKQPNWDLLGIAEVEAIANLPSVKWKMLNLEKLEKSRHKALYEKLEVVLSRKPQPPIS